MKQVLRLVFCLTIIINCLALGAPIAFITDIEGSKTKLKKFMAEHELFYRGDDKRFHLRPKAHFVCGGDVTDRFFGDTTVVRELLRLKAEAPSRVHLLAGNRDMNKIRIFCELSRKALEQEPWEFAKEWRLWLKIKGLKDNRVNRLHWILAETMGAPSAFELRRKELTEKNLPNTDEDIVDSFIKETAPGSPFALLLSLSVVIAKVENTVFVHGGLTPENIGRVPGAKRVFKDVDEWTVRLNRWYRLNLLDWRIKAASWNGRAPFPGINLVTYSRKTDLHVNNPISVVYNRTTDDANKVKLPSAEVISYLLENGINRLALGHTPSGQIPVILRSPKDDFETIVADNSYGQMKEQPSFVTFNGDNTSIRSLLRVDGNPLEVNFTTKLGQKSMIGKRQSNGSVIVAETEDSYINYQLKPGFKVVYTQSPKVVTLNH